MSSHSTKIRLDVAAIPVNCRFAAAFSNKMSLQISLPGLPERHFHLGVRLICCGFGGPYLDTAMICLRVLSFADLA
jgi:hypothetical protein